MVRSRGHVSRVLQIPDEEYLPDKYNVRSELELVIPPGSGAITQDYDLAE